MEVLKAMDQTTIVKERIAVLLRRKTIVIASMILGTMIGVYLARTIPPAYRSSTLIMVEQQQVPQSYVMPTDVTPVEKRLSTISQQIMSRTRLEKIIEDYNLYRSNNGPYWTSSSLGIINGFGPKGSDAQRGVTGKEELVERMRKDIEIKAIGEGGGKGDAFSISYSSGDPYTAMQVTNTIASLFIEENSKTREQYAEDTAELLATELESSKKELENQDKAIKAFKETYMGRLPEQMDANLKTLDRLQMELASVQTSLKGAEERKALLEEQILNGSLNSGTGKAAIGSDPLVAELARLNKELASLLSLYKESYPDVAITKSRIREVRRLLDESKKASPAIQEPEKEEGKSNDNAAIASIKSQIAVFKKQEAVIKDQIGTFQRRVEGTPEIEQMMANMMRDYEASKKNYQSLLEKKMNAKLAENMEKGKKGELFRIIDPANFPERPYKPDKRRIALSGLLGGTGIGIGMAFMLEIMTPVFRRPEDFIGVLNKPVLASVPVFFRKQVPRPGTRLKETKITNTKTGRR